MLGTAGTGRLSLCVCQECPKAAARSAAASLSLPNGIADLRLSLTLKLQLLLGTVPDLGARFAGPVLSHCSVLRLLRARTAPAEPERLQHPQSCSAGAGDKAPEQGVKHHRTMAPPVTGWKDLNTHPVLPFHTFQQPRLLQSKPEHSQHGPVAFSGWR